MELGNLFLPTYLDYNEKNNKVSFEHPDYGTQDYIENSECNLQLFFSGTIVYIDYYVEDGYLLSENLTPDGEHIASGDLECEFFSDIQYRALLELIKHLANGKNKKEIINLFKNGKLKKINERSQPNPTDLA